MITYEYTKDGHSIKVLLEKRIIGHIKPVRDKWAYFPKGSKSSGEEFKTIALVKKSLENE